ncbi:MAG: hypothetical protein R2769_12745 [Saprospiraceae bacterium]
MGISEDEWRLGTMFTRGATGIIPGKGGSLGTPKRAYEVFDSFGKGGNYRPNYQP